MARSILVSGVILCLSFTGAGEVRADEQQPGALRSLQKSLQTLRIGGSLELGTLAGFTSFRGTTATTMGTGVGAFIRLGRLELGTEYDYAWVVGDSKARASARLPDTDVEARRPRGVVKRFALAGRIDVARFRRGFAGKNSALTLWVSGSLGRQQGMWHDESTVNRRTVSVGWGFSLLHRADLATRPRRLDTVAWRFGWRLTSTPRINDDDRPPDNVACFSAGVQCARAPRGPALRDISLLVTSSFDFNW